MASLGRMLQVVVVVLGVAAMVHSQVIEIGACRNYQSSNRFSKAFIEKMININESYGIILTTDNALPCQQLRLFSNGTFLYTYATSSQDIEEFTGPFTAKTSSFSEAGYLDLVMPSGVFGNGLLGNLRLYVLMATDDYLVVASCWPLAIIRVENIHAMVPNSKFDLNTPTNLNKTLEKHGVPHVNRLKEVAQLCEGTIPDTLQEMHLQELRFANASINLPNIRSPNDTFTNATSKNDTFPGNFSIPSLISLISLEPQAITCKEGQLPPLNVCLELLLLADSINLILNQIPIPICRPIYKDIFAVFCDYATSRHSLPFLYSSDPVEGNDVKFNFKIGPPVTTYSSYPNYNNPVLYPSRASPIFDQLYNRNSGHQHNILSRSNVEKQSSFYQSYEPYSNLYHHQSLYRSQVLTNTFGRHSSAIFKYRNARQSELLFPRVNSFAERSKSTADDVAFEFEDDAGSF